MQQVQKIFREPLSKIKFDDLLQNLKDIVNNTLMSKSRKRSNSNDNFNNTTHVEDGVDASTVSNHSAVREGSNNPAEDTLNNSPYVQNILNGSQILRDEVNVQNIV